ncbi:gp18 [Burkholderia phage KS14]|uniref:Gp18 n=1 Tax=Burkholderia phage KS14 TaxID=910475 RepID=E5FFH1_9CAUD|nr:tail protein [Burkholderia phage KS14]ADP02363.1 gp18 [Burkholderia phage KS14]
MAGTLITITDAGRAALVAPGNTGTNAHQVVKIGLASAPFVADKGMLAMPNERKRITTFAGKNIAADTVHVTLKDDTDDQFTLYGFGLYLENDVLLGVYSQATPIMEKSPAAMLLLSADIQFTTIDAAAITFGEASFANPPATTEVQGVIELATQAEVDAGTDTVRALTPKTAASRYAALTGATFAGPVRATKLQSDGDATIGTSLTIVGQRGALITTGNFDGLSIEAYDTANVTTKKAVALAPYGGRVLIGKTPADDDLASLLQVAGIATVATPPAGDSSKKVATTEWVIATVATALVGQIVIEARTSARAGFLKLNGAVLKRADYPALWAYAQASGALLTDAQWGANNFGAFSSGDGATTFRIPELRGEYMRFWDDGRGVDAGRGIGSWQDSQNRSHAHGASAGAVGDHAHSAWTDVQGWHDHGDPWKHALNSGTANGSDGAEASDAGGGWRPRTDANGNHVHNVGIGAAGAHSHGITINADGGAEVRVRSLAMLAMIRAY